MKTIVKRSFFDSFFNRFQTRSFLKTTHSFWTLRKRITIVFENDIFLKTLSDRCLYDCFFKTIVNEGLSLSYAGKSCGGAKNSWYFLLNYSMISTDALQVGFLLSSLTIVNEGSSLTIVNGRLSFTIVNETTNFLKTIVFENDSFFKTISIKKRSF